MVERWTHKSTEDAQIHFKSFSVSCWPLKCFLFQRSPTRSIRSPALPPTARPSLTTWTSLTLLAPTSSTSWRSTPLIPKTRRICARWPPPHPRARSVMGGSWWFGAVAASCMCLPESILQSKIVALSSCRYNYLSTSLCGRRTSGSPGTDQRFFSHEGLRLSFNWSLVGRRKELKSLDLTVQS